MTVRVAILSDTHGYVWPQITEAVQQCDYAVHAGDIGGAEVLDQLRPKIQLLAVRGNNDMPFTWEQDEHHVLASIQHREMIELPGGTLAVVHGHEAGRVSDRHENLRKQFPDARIIVYGHSHQLTVDKNKDIWVVNPGAAGRARTHGGPSWMILSASKRNWELQTYRLEI